MSYKASFNGVIIEADTIQELNQLLGLMETRVKQKTTPVTVVGETQEVSEEVEKRVLKGKERREYGRWKREHFEFLVANIDNRTTLRALPFPGKTITAKVWAFRNNKWSLLPKAGKLVLEEYNTTIDRFTPKELLPKIKEL